jgi:hypothetical protein
MTEVRMDSAKWATRSQAAVGEYKKGVQAPRRSWSGAASASEGNYEAGVNAAISRKAFGKGVNAAGDAKWKNGADTKGGQRYGSGVAAGQDAYQKGFAPFADVIRATTLTPRGPKGTNYGRVQEIGEALSARKNQ